MRKSILLFIIGSIVFNSIAAQNETKTNILSNTAKVLETKSRSSFSEAIIKSKEKGWPIRLHVNKSIIRLRSSYRKRCN